ncbi:hypothetical protein FQZ97_958510 [compost metagenome]
MKSPRSTMPMAQWAIQSRALSVSPAARALRTASIQICFSANQPAARRSTWSSSSCRRRRRRCSRNSGWKLNHSALRSRPVMKSCRRSSSAISARPSSAPARCSASGALNLSTAARFGNWFASSLGRRLSNWSSRPVMLFARRGPPAGRWRRLSRLARRAAIQPSVALCRSNSSPGSIASSPARRIRSRVSSRSKRSSPASTSSRASL